MKITEENHPELTCPICGNLLIHINDEKDGQLIDCKWTCVPCRNGLRSPMFYGYTQSDINNQTPIYEML